ncbi:hypothetical protein Mal15_47890 [Stieleria maiorica]|uniref:Uncharacterized protein n=1 Tax=Stieleria maiorica TaxID=2795974 RepID=A0A5B9ML50_9BACT|nr:hypothetical protein [Stieleria maiorica]QEG00717.1 hypothetical protein Mal15_47890 [Stieleria maiorica]
MNLNSLSRRRWLQSAAAGTLAVAVGSTKNRSFAADGSPEVVPIGSRRELFVDDELIQSLNDVNLVLHRPRDEGQVLSFDEPWEGGFCGYATVIRDGDRLRLYYRGLGVAGQDGNRSETTCYAESTDGVTWTKPDLGLFEVKGTRQNNVVLSDAAPVTHNFSPMLDTRPGVRQEERYKALGGTVKSGLVAWVSADGTRWRRLQDAPVIPSDQVPFPHFFDSQNLAFWSAAEQQYVCFFRVFQDKIRRIARSVSDDFVHWSPPVVMGYRHRGDQAPIEHLYTNQTHPYFRAPHLYVSIAARFMPRRQVLTDDQARAIDVNPRYFKDTSDAILMTARPGRDYYNRTFLSSFVRPGIGARNWVSRTNYPALNVVQTGPTEMSVYLNQDYAQPTAHLRRYSMRLDGFASAQADYHGGELITKPLTFAGSRLAINFATSAAGDIRVEIQDASGQPIPGFTLAESREQIGNEIDRIVTWNSGPDVSPLAGRPVRLRFAMKDADLFAMQFTDAASSG